jgi:hypothetical protein
MACKRSSVRLRYSPHKTFNVPGVQLFRNTPGTNYAETLPQHANFSGMESAEVPYTIPRLVKGKALEFVPKGSTKSNQIAKMFLRWSVAVCQGRL